MRLYLDNCCFNRPFDDQNQLKIKLETEAKLFIQHEILVGKHDLVWSYILEFENNQNPFDDKRATVYGWKNLAKTYCSENAEILKFAEKLRENNIRTKDALHLACAAYTKSDYFITVDKQLCKLHLNEINIVNPVNLIGILEGR
ncbi:MAG: PIN domain-containing protein [Treponemataceae bacterium]|nr:MAG: PIN domain-containing protein [Treponemataceae bacterium]